MEEMLVLARAARRGAADTFLIGDMPQGSYEVDNRTAVLNALRFVKEAGCDAVKLEGGTRVAGRVRAIAEAGILVMGHLGLTPQSAATFGGYRVQGRTPDVFEQILNDAHRLAEAGAFALLLEAMPSESAGQVARQVDFPVYGIGAGGEVDGQLVVVHDLLGMFRPFRPSFCRCYVPDVVERFQRHLVALGSSPEPPPPGKDGLLELIEMAIAAYVRDVRHGAFPSAEHCYPLAKGELERLEASSHWVRRLERART
jgi:3-methyl-2-oxobutanoate hydroxymethyltransferase